MTPLLTRMRPFASHAPRIRLPHLARSDRTDRTDRSAGTDRRPAALPTLQADEERLATKAEIDLLLHRP